MKVCLAVCVSVSFHTINHILQVHSSDAWECDKTVMQKVISKKLCANQIMLSLAFGTSCKLARCNELHGRKKHG